MTNACTMMRRCPSHYQKDDRTSVVKVPHKVLTKVLTKDKVLTKVLTKDKVLRKS
jgi:hypothetical protein